MKRTTVFIFGILSAGCESHSNTKEYLDVYGEYCLEVRERENTCGCDGPRELDSPMYAYFYRKYSANLESKPEAYFWGGGLSVPLHLDGFGEVDGYVDDYEEMNSAIDSVAYDGTFTGTNGVANFHKTTGSYEEPCLDFDKPCHLRVQYHEGYCCNGGAGYNVVILSGPKVLPCGEDGFTEYDTSLSAAVRQGE